jgi:hypothetical protein
MWSGVLWPVPGVFGLKNINSEKLRVYAKWKKLEVPLTPLEE